MTDTVTPNDTSDTEAAARLQASMAKIQALSQLLAGAVPTDIQADVMLAALLNLYVGTVQAYPHNTGLAVNALITTAQHLMASYDTQRPASAPVH